MTLPPVSMRSLGVLALHGLLAGLGFVTWYVALTLYFRSPVQLYRDSPGTAMDLFFRYLFGLLVYLGILITLLVTKDSRSFAVGLVLAHLSNALVLSVTKPTLLVTLDYAAIVPYFIRLGSTLIPTG